MKFQNRIGAELKLKNKVYQFVNEYEFGITDDSKKDVSLNSDVTLCVDDLIMDLKDGQKYFYKKIFNKDTICKLKLNFKFYKDKNGDYRYQYKIGYNHIDLVTGELVRDNHISYDFKAIKDKQLENLSKLGNAAHWSFGDYLNMLYPDYIADDTKICGAVYFATLDHEVDNMASKIIQFEDGYSKFILDGEEHDLKDWIAEPYHYGIDPCWNNEDPHNHIGLFIYFASYSKKHYVDDPKSCKFNPDMNNRNCIFALHKPNK